MNTKHLILSAAILFTLLACGQQHKEKDSRDGENATEHNSKHHSHDSTKTANE